MKTVKTRDRDLGRSDVTQRINLVDRVNGICNNAVCATNIILDSCPQTARDALNDGVELDWC